ncbi:MAG: type IV toxin-antitoxin system AbiEi family antitoxin domain-containing protein [Oscillospiraceae bacterium]|nr:type IV toxin-antitoxin system AbiEi family antitoxin domain-containing protein [Oscillospiraceae bacterium]
MDQIWMNIQTVAKKNNGYIRTSQVEDLGISRPMIKKYLDMGLLEQVCKGLYALAEEIADEYALIQARSSKAVFSYGTALYLWGLSDRTPHFYDITLPRGTNSTKLKRDNPNLRCHYVQQEIYEMGITETQSPQGAVVKLYDRERCICDLIRYKDQVDMQLYSQAIKDYFKSKPNPRKLLKYGKVFGIDDKIRMYMEVL